jgi:mannose-6-phosphate isomerase-like protein (cupin superfamily)
MVTRTCRFYFSKHRQETGRNCIRNSHPYQEIFVIQAGQVTFTLGDATIEATAGQIVIAPARIPHKFVNSGKTPLRSINIHPSSCMITEWLEDREKTR